MDHRNNKNSHNSLYQSIRAMPKVELHRHLEGTLRLETLAEIAHEHKIELPGYDTETIRPLVQITDDDQAHSQAYLSKFAVLRGFYQSREIIERVAYEAVADAASENTIYFEMRFTPLALTKVRDFRMDDAADWVIDMVEQASREYGIDVRLIMSMNRHESVEIGQAIMEIAVDRQDRGVVGLDLAGNEADFPGVDFEPIFRKARESGLGMTIHAGEWAGPESIRLAIDVLGASRLGHGVRIIEDPDLLQETRERGIVYEVCPTSNIQSGVYGSYEQHPLKAMYQAGLLTTINTDNTSVSALNLTDELVRTVEQIGLSIDDVKQNILHAARAAFLTPGERECLIGRLTAEFAPDTHISPQ
ncbi:MAG: adenosine deaminase [Anaerolineae bacterium]|nr:adenosine deaminase [Anaerolineae bacterium]